MKNSMKQITITIRTEGAAFEDDPQSEVINILHSLAFEFEDKGGLPQTIRDGYGDTCGTVVIESEAE